MDERVRVFSEDCAYEIERRINDWLERAGNSIRIIKRLQNTVSLTKVRTNTENVCQITITIFFEVVKKSDASTGRAD